MILISKSMPKPSDGCSYLYNLDALCLRRICYRSMNGSMDWGPLLQVEGAFKKMNPNP